MKRPFLFFASLALILVATLCWILKLGTELQTPTQAGRISGEPLSFVAQELSEGLRTPLAIMLLQIAVIMLAIRIIGWGFAKINQPQVVGEIIAGVLLGPSLLGLLFPQVSSFVFPVASLPNLQALSQIGLVLFMFVVGLDLDLKTLTAKARDAFVISQTSILVPYALGVGLAYAIYRSFAPLSVPFIAFALFIGISLSITAFPVLARIVQERKMVGTAIGDLALTCAAAADVIAWCLLAIVLAIAKAGAATAGLVNVGLAGVYLLVMLQIVRPVLGRLKGSGKNLIPWTLLTLIVSAYAAEIIHIHALFGAFLAGVIIPADSEFRRSFREKIEDVVLVLLLPLFFVFTGLRTQIGLLDSPYLWLICIGVIAVAVLGKFGGAALGARFVGYSWRDSFTLGALMNTRGLMELIVLNIGYELGILSPTLFTMMVVMALATTLMTGPLLSIIERKQISASG